MQNVGQAADGSDRSVHRLICFFSRSGSVHHFDGDKLLAKLIMKLSSKPAAFFVLDLKLTAGQL